MKPARQHDWKIAGWQTDLLIIIGGTKHQARNAYLEHWGFDAEPEPDTTDPAHGSFFSSAYGRACAIWLPTPPRTAYEIGNAAHEALHATMHIMARCGVELTKHTDDDGHQWVNDEPWTYLTASIVEEIIRFSQRETRDQKDTMSYYRVIPRDLFNEANFLKCLGQLAILHLDGMLPENVGIDHDGKRFKVYQDEDGSLRIKNFTLTIAGERIDLYRPLNSREDWPLWFERGDEIEGTVFDKHGEISADFKSICESTQEPQKAQAARESAH